MECTTEEGAGWSRRLPSASREKYLPPGSRKNPENWRIQEDILDQARALSSREIHDSVSSKHSVVFYS